MAYRLTDYIKVGKARFHGINHIKIERSIHTLVDTAIIKTPQTAILKKLEDDTRTKVEITKQVKKGDQVIIDLGHDGENKPEFRGFVSKIDHKDPIEIHCEDFFYLLKEKTIKKSYEKTTLQNVLSDLLEGVKDNEGNNVLLDDNSVDLNIKNLQLHRSGNAITRSKALQMIKDRYGLTIFFDLDGKLYAGLLNGKVTGNEKHRFGFNIVDAKGLEYKDADETKLKIKAISVLEDGTRIEETAGEDNGAERTLFFNDIEDREQLRQLAEQEKNKYKYSGYDGKFRTLLKPYVTSAMTTEIEDPEFGKRSGKYYINSVTTKYGYNGDEKVVEIGSRLS